MGRMEKASMKRSNRPGLPRKPRALRVMPTAPRLPMATDRSTDHSATRRLMASAGP